VSELFRIEDDMIKVSGRHKSVPREIKRSLTRVLPLDSKIVMNDICSCRHAYKTGTLKITSEDEHSLNIRGYYGGGVLNLFVKFVSLDDKNIAIDKIKQQWG